MSIFGMLMEFRIRVPSGSRSIVPVVSERATGRMSDSRMLGVCPSCTRLDHVCRLKSLAEITLLHGCPPL